MRKERIVHLHSPIKDEDILDLKIGDIVYINGELFTSRDACHMKINEGATYDFDLKGACIYHAGPIVRINDKGYSLISCGPTTSNRMTDLEDEFLLKTQAKILIGKGGMGKKVEDACKKYKCIHCAYPGGCGVLASQMIEKVEDVRFLELGMAEALWKFKVKEFGPLVVSIDTLGNNLFENNKKKFTEKRNELK